MITNQEPKQPYEGAILQQLIKNSERLAVMEKDIVDVKQEIVEVKKTLETARWLLVTIAVGVLINIFSQPILGLIS